MSANKTQADLQKAAGVTQGFISNIESGRHRASWDVLDKIAKCLGTSIEKIIFETNFNPEGIESEQRANIMATIRLLIDG